MSDETIPSFPSFEGLDGKLVYLNTAWFLDIWKAFLFGKNLLNAERMKQPLREMILLNQKVDGAKYFYRVQHTTKTTNAVDTQLILANAIGRVLRVLWRGTAKLWAREKWLRIPLIPYMPIVQYMIWEQTFHKISCSAISMDVALSLKGIRVPRRDNIVWDGVERVLMDLSSLSVLGLAEGKEVLPFVWFMAAVVIAIIGYVFFVVWFIFDDLGRQYFQIKSDGAPPQYAAKANQLGFNPKNILVVKRGYFDVKYYNLMIMGWIMNWMVGRNTDGFLFIDENVARLPVKTVDSLIALELGHWQKGRSRFLLAVQLLRTVALGIFLMVTYDNQTINGWYSFPKDDPPDAIIPMMIGYQWIWPFFADFFNYAQSLSRWWMVYEADAFACQNVRPTDLIRALYTVAGCSENYPIFDELYSAWILGCPTVQSRVANIKKIARNRLLTDLEKTTA